MTSARVQEFLPSTSGLHFSNSYPAGTPYPIITLPVLGNIGSGDAGNGLCGGFVMTVLDLFLHAPRFAPPPDTSRPAVNSLLFNYLVDRLMDSLGRSNGFGTGVRVVDWIQSPGDESQAWSGNHGLAYRML